MKLEVVVVPVAEVDGKHEEEIGQAGPACARRDQLRATLPARRVIGPGDVAFS